MAIRDVTRQQVEAAIKTDGPQWDGFVEKYGKGKSTSGCKLEYDDKDYDPKVILGAAHELAGLGELEIRPRDHDAVIKHLRRLRFHVPKTSLNWTRDELILAADLVRENNWDQLNTNDKRVHDLSDLLQELPIHPMELRPRDFRNHAGVAQKTRNIADHHPKHSGEKSHGGAGDAEVFKDFFTDGPRMHEVAQVIRETVEREDFQQSYEDLPDLDDRDDDDEGTPEGRLLKHKHFRRERNRKKRQQKIDQYRRAHGGKLACETCGFDFGEVYGDHGEGYIECHHVVPLHASGETNTKLADLILICSNCHRMIHWRSPWLTPDELRALLQG